MRSPALAIGWEFRRRHRWGLIAVAGYLFAVAAIRFLILEPGEPVLVDSVRLAAVVSVPLTTTVVYLLAVFSFGFAGDLAARQSMYPARMFTLPVTNAALVGSPMLYGTAAMAILCLAARLFAVWPSGIEIPLIWPALLAAALLACTQARRAGASSAGQINRISIHEDRESTRLNSRQQISTYAVFYW